MTLDAAFWRAWLAGRIMDLFSGLTALAFGAYAALCPDFLQLHAWADLRAVPEWAWAGIGIVAGVAQLAGAALGRALARKAAAFVSGLLFGSVGLGLAYGVGTPSCIPTLSFFGANTALLLVLRD